MGWPAVNCLTVKVGALVPVILELDGDATQTISSGGRPGHREIKFDSTIHIKGPNLPEDMASSMDSRVRKEVVEKAKAHRNSVNAKEELENRLNQTNKIKNHLEETGQPSDTIMPLISKTESDLYAAKALERSAFETLKDLAQRIQEQSSVTQRSDTLGSANPQ